MAASRGLELSLLVEDAKVAITSDVELLVTAIIDNQTKRTSTRSSVKPRWNEELHFNIKNVTGSLKIQLSIHSSMRQQLLGFTTIPLYTIRHTTKHSKGNWKILHSRSVSGELTPTDHALRLDAYFALPKDIPLKEMRGLEEKLNSFSQILEEEANVLQNQKLKLKMKELPLPSLGRGDYLYPNVVGMTHLSLPTSKSSTLSRSSSGDSDLSIENRSATWSNSTMFGKKTSTAKLRWQTAVAHPMFQEEVLELMKQSRPNKGFNPAILELNGDTLLHRCHTRKDQLFTDISASVTHLQGFEEGFCRKRTKAYSKQSVNAMNQIRSKLNRNRSREQLQITRHTIDEDMRIHVYKVALATLIYPVSELHHHQFEEKSFTSPTYCRECEGFIYGMMKQGYQCKRCGKTCHKRCVASARPDCFHIKSTNASYAESLLMAITDEIESRLRKNESMFALMREAFNVADNESRALIDEVSKTVKHLARNFSAVVSIKVIAAQGLAVHTISDDLNLYVSMDVGGVKKRTKALKTNNSSWNEEFKLYDHDCTNILEPIKIRVWNERHNTWGKLSQKFTTEGDLFLGQKTIEVMTLGAAQDLWYTLEKRTDNNIVSGSINLNVSCVVAGEFHVASFHQMYSLMHEQLFLYEHIKELNSIALLTEKGQTGDNFEVTFFNSESQTILDRFATRYAIEPIFRIMVHTKLLADHSAYIVNGYCGLINALELIKTQLFTLAAIQNSILAFGMTRMLHEVFSASNFGKDNFSRCIDKLLTQLKVEMQQYRALYPADDKTRLQAFENSCNLTRLILELQVKVMGKDPKQQNRNLNEVLKSCMVECINQTFDDIVQQIVPENFDGHPGFNKSEKPYEFYYSLLDGMESMEHEDRTVYQPLVEKYCSFVLGDIVALTVWNLFKDTIEDIFQVDEHLTVFPPMEAIHLLFTVKDYYIKHVYPVFPRGNIPDIDYPYWFKPAVIFWIEDFQKKTQEVIRNAWTIDKSSNFEPQNDSKFSSSSFDMIDYFLKGQLVVRKFDEDVMELRHSYNHAYAGVIKSTIVNYCDMISSEITNRTDLEVSSMLINNIQFLRHGVETIYNAMGGEEGAGNDCTTELKELQTILGRQVNSWCKYIGKSIKDNIWEGIQQVHLEIINVKSAGPLTKSDCKFDKILSVLFQYCKTFRECCEEKVILPKLINKIWVIVVQGLHNMLLPPMPGIAREDVEESPVTFVPHCYSTKHCNVVDKLLDYLKDFFQDDSLGVKAETLANNIKQLKVFTKLYGQTTDALISEFIKDFAAKACYNNCESTGEVSLEVSAYRHPATGEFDGSIRIISARDLLGFHEVQVLKPHVELNLIVPGLDNTTKYKYTASTKDTSHSPSFNQTFKFVLPPNNLCELAIIAKHKTMLGGSRIIGVAVIPLKTALQSDMHTIDLHYSLPLTDYGRVLLTILAQRPHDDKAKEFVELKTRSRTK